MYELALIIGVCPGLSSSLARLCASNKMKVILAARDINKLDSLKKEIDAITISCDASDNNSVKKLFEEVDNIGLPNLLLGKSYFVELLQNNFTKENINKAIKETLSFEQSPKDIADILREMLVGIGYSKAAKEITLI